MTRVPDQGNFALVSYVPEPLASFLYEMRQRFTVNLCPRPHITFLPPRPLQVTADIACRLAQRIIETQPQFEVELCRVRCFAGTNTLYLDIGDGAAEIHTLHDFLNGGLLRHKEEFDFRPHLTVAGPVSAENLTTVLHHVEREWAAASFPNRFVLSHIDCLLQAGDGTWLKLCSAQLNGTSTEPIALSANKASSD